MDKKKESEDMGVKEYYILDAFDTYTAFYRQNDEGIFEPIKPLKRDVIRSNVLKFFQLPLSDLFSKPSL